jgi:hypothetical protein
MMPRVQSCHPILRGLALACALAAGVAGPPAAAGAATLTTDARCYLQAAQLRMTAGGLTPAAPLTVSLDGRALRYGDGSAPDADAAGSFAGAFAVPALTAGVPQQRHALAVSDGGHTPHTHFTVTRPAGADFQPAAGDPRTLRARFRVWGFGLGGGRGAGRVRVWLHWIAPDRTVRASAALGTARGDCGALATAARRVFPFAAQAGRWLLVVDTHRRYRMQASGPRAKIPVQLRPLSH